MVAILLDIATLAIALEIASLVVFGNPVPWAVRSDATEMVFVLGVAGLVGIFLAFRPAAQTGILRPSYGRAVTAASIMVGFAAVSLVFSRFYWSRPYLLVTVASWVGMGFVHRWIRRRRPWTEPMVIITQEKVLVDHLLEAPHVEVVAVLDPSGVGPDRPLAPGVTLAVDLRSVLSDDMARFVSSINLAGYPMRSLTSVYEEHTGRLPIVHLMEGWELTVPLAGRGGYVRVKRFVDTMLILLTLPLTIPLGLLISLAIAVESRGGVIFKQRRIGLGGKPFTLYKFRTMEVGSDRVARFAAPRDERLTRVGRLLRRLRIDELPQLWNVLRGDLALVGPRPEQGPFVDRFNETIPFYSHRHLVRPGVTGWAQVNFGYADNLADTIEKLSYDLYYVKHVSTWLDLEILGRSVWTIVSGFGAR